MLRSPCPGCPSVGAPAAPGPAAPSPAAPSPVLSRGQWQAEPRPGGAGASRPPPCCASLLAADLFDILLPMLNIYQEFVRNHQYSLQILAHCKQNRDFDKLLKHYEAKPDCEERTLETFLTYPMFQVTASSRGTTWWCQTLSPAGSIWWWGRISRGWNPCRASAARAVLGWGCGGDPALPGQRWGTAGSWADPEPSLPSLSFSTRSLGAFTTSQIRGLEVAAGGDREPSVRPQPTRIPPRPRLMPCCGLLCCRSPGTS